MPKLRSTYDRRLIHKTSYEGRKQWRRQKEEVGWVLASVRQPNAEGVRSEAPRGRGAAGAETSAEGARGGGRVWYVPLSPSGANHITVYQKRTRLAQSAIRRGGFSNSELRMPNTAESHAYRPSDVTADFRHCQVGSRQFRSQYFSASKSSIKRAQVFFLYIFQKHRGITVSLDALCF